MSKIETDKYDKKKERNTLLKLSRQIFQEKENYTEEELSKLKIKYEKLCAN